MSSESESGECHPIKHLQTLLEWETSDITWNKLVREKSKRTDYVYGSLEKSTKYVKSSMPRTLLCHDMKGGYLEDRYVHGTSDVTDPYIFTYWSCVDTFVYFSHHFVTIPPPGWINAAHLHGVQVLGTVITEWIDGKSLWLELFEDSEKLDKVIDKLVEICTHCKFDGYLINIENEVPVEHLDKMKHFVKKLTQLIHTHVEDSLVIWYDSVISPSGELKWQNELNELNKDFFQSSDGIFLNYNWTEKTLARSLQNAGTRKHDVYVGVDVFGRGCFGGGGFNSNLAMEKIREFGLSAAIFGHGWTHETKEDESFQDRDVLFWSKLEPYLYNHELAMKEKFYTSFNNGFGKFKFQNGHKNEDHVMYNLSKQSIQPCSLHEYEYEDGFNGSGCLKINQSELDTNQLNHLFLTRIEINEFPIKLTLATKCSESYSYRVSVLYEYKHQKHKFILQKDEKMDDKESLEDFSSTILYDLDYSNNRRDKRLIWFNNSWDIRTFTIHPEFKGYITQIGIVFNSVSRQLLLGQLDIKN